MSGTKNNHESCEPGKGTDKDMVGDGNKGKKIRESEDIVIRQYYVHGYIWTYRHEIGKQHN